MWILLPQSYIFALRNLFVDPGTITPDSVSKQWPPEPSGSLAIAKNMLPSIWNAPNIMKTSLISLGSLLWTFFAIFTVAKSTFSGNLFGLYHCFLYYIYSSRWKRDMFHMFHALSGVFLNKTFSIPAFPLWGVFQNVEGSHRFLLIYNNSGLAIFNLVNSR